jgi:hypothetical protein
MCSFSSVKLSNCQENQRLIENLVLLDPVQNNQNTVLKLSLTLSVQPLLKLCILSKKKTTKSPLRHKGYNKQSSPRK